MRYTKPEIQNESKATTQIMGTPLNKKGTNVETATKPTIGSAYEADE
jgi:hypothetical protein